MAKVPNTPNNEWYEKRNHVRIPKIAEAKAWLDTDYTGGGGIAPPVPDPFDVAMWTIEDYPSDSGNKVKLTVISLPADNGSPIIDILAERVDGVGKGSIGAAVPGAYILTVNAPPGERIDGHIYAVNANGISDQSDMKSVTPTFLPTPVPDPFTAPMWGVADHPSTSGTLIDLTINSLPADNGFPITGVFVYIVDGNGYIDIGGLAPGVYTLDLELTPGQPADIQVFSENANGFSDPSDTKTVTPTIITASVPDAFTAPMWTLTDVPSPGGNTVRVDILELPDDGNSPLIDLVADFGFGDVSLETTEIGGHNIQLPVLGGTLVSCTIRAVNSVGHSAPSDTKQATTTVVLDTDRYHGRNPNLDNGTVFDVYVALNGDDGNDGSIGSPMRNPAAAAAANPGKTIGVRGGVYREIWNFTNPASGTAQAPTKVMSYGTESVVVTGANAIVGWAQCDAADSPVLGNDFAKWWKLTIPANMIADSDPFCAFLCEGGNALPLAAERILSNVDFCHYMASEPWQTGVIYNDGQGANPRITGVYKPEVTDLYTAEDILRGKVYIHTYPNLSSLTTVASFDDQTKIMTLANAALEYDTNHADRNKFILLNMPKSGKPGNWAFVDNGDTTVTLYLWPKDAAKVNDPGYIEYSARTNVINLAGPNYFELIGIEARQSASSGADTQGYAISAFNGSTRRNGVAIRQCNVTTSFRSRAAFAAITLEWINYWVVEHCNITKHYQQFGFQARSGGQPADESDFAKYGLFRRNFFEQVSISAMRNYTQDHAAYIHNYVGPFVGIGAHANKQNNYQWCDQTIVFGNNLEGGSGYVTYQRSSNSHYLFNYIPGSYSDGRAFVDQNGLPSPAEMFGRTHRTAYVMHNTMPPFGPQAGVTNAVNYGSPSNPTLLADFDSNIMHGIGVGVASAINPAYSTRSENLLTSGTVINDDTLQSAAACYVDHLNGDLTLQATSAARGLVTKDKTQILNFLLSTFPQVPSGDWLLDPNFNAIDWALPIVGAAQDGEMVSKSSWWTVPPVVAGANAAHFPLQVTGGYRVTQPRLPLSYQVYSSDDLDTWFPIVGETDDTFVPDDTYIGKYIGWNVMDAKGEQFVYNNLPVTATYALGFPEFPTPPAQVSVSSGMIESAVFTAEDRPLVVELHTRLTGTTLGNITATIGAPGRLAGEGTPLTIIDRKLRTNSQISLAFAETNAEVGDVTIQITNDVASSANYLIAYYVDNAKSVSTMSTSVGTASRLTVAKNSVIPGSIVAFATSQQSSGGQIETSGPGVEQLAAARVSTNAFGFGVCAAPTIEDYTGIAANSTNTSAAMILGAYVISP